MAKKKSGFKATPALQKSVKWISPLKALLSALATVSIDVEVLLSKRDVVVDVIRRHYGDSLPSMHAMYYTLLGRYAEMPFANIEFFGFEDVVDWIFDAVRSEEFRKRFINLVETEYPGVHKTVFLHIPKTAGSYVRETLKMQPRSILVDYSGDIFMKRGPLDILSVLLSFNAGRIDKIFVSGHYFLQELIDGRVMSPMGRVFTVVRNPVDMIISSINYILSCMLNVYDSEYNNPWWRVVLSESGISLDRDDPKSLRDFGCYLLRSEQFFCDYRSPLTRVFSSGGLEQAFERCDIYRIEFVDIDNLCGYLSSELGVSVFPGEKKINESEKIFSGIDDFSLSDKAYIFDRLCGSDMLFYDYVMQLTRKSSRGWSYIS